MNDNSVAIKIIEKIFFTWRNFHDIKLSENEKYDPYFLKIHLYSQTIEGGNGILLNSSLFLDLGIIGNSCFLLYTFLDFLFPTIKIIYF